MAIKESVSLREEITTLIDLQQVDDELSDLEMELGELPEQVTKLKAVLEEGEHSIQNFQKETKDNVLLRHQLEMEIDSFNEQLKKYKEQLYLVQTNKEYDAISKEIDTVQIEISSRETKVLQLWSREEELKELLEQLHNTQNTSGKEYQEKSVELNKKLAETQGEKLQLEHEREKLVMKLKKPVYNHYERIRKVRDGKGVADVYNGACGGCFSTIPPQRLVEIENMTDFIFCETCGRILVMNSEMNY